MSIKDMNTGALIARLAIYSRAETNYDWCPPIAKLYASHANQIQHELCTRFGSMEVALAAAAEEAEAQSAQLDQLTEDNDTLRRQFDEYLDAVSSCYAPTEYPRPYGLWNEFDSSVWAKQFMATRQQMPGFVMDEKTMDAWFAQAIMAGYYRAMAEVHARESTVGLAPDNGTI